MPADTVAAIPDRTVRAGIAAVLVVALLAAVFTVVRAHGMWTAPGTMGIGAPAFVGTWGVMMAAMMLPSIAPVTGRYLRSLDGARTWRATLFVGGYVLLWATSGIAVYVLAVVADTVVARAGLAPRLFAAAVLATSAVYHLTPISRRLLKRCRNPLGLIMEYAGYRGALRDLRAGLHHGLTCLGCCWALMALMVVFGTMNVAAMVVLGLVVAAEKLWARGMAVARGIGVASAVLAVAVLASPELAVGLSGGEM